MSSGTLKRTYIFPLPGKESAFRTLITSDSTDGSANFGSSVFADLQAALNASFSNTADISLTKTATLNLGANNALEAGDTISYAFTVTNTGGLTISNITLSDPLLVAPNGSLTGGPLASLAPGATDSSTFHGTYTLTSADISAGGVRNTATVTGTSSGGSVSDTSGALSYLDAPTDVVFNQTASINLVKQATLNDGGDGRADAGDTISYSFTVTNDGNQTVSGITVTDPKITVSGGPVTLAAGASDSSSFTGVYTLTQADIDAGSVANTAYASGTDPNGWAVSDVSGAASGNDTPTTLNLTADPQISLVKAGVVNGTGTNGAARSGDTITYTFSVTNTGNVTLTNITLTDPLLTVSGGPITLAPGATNSFSFTGSYALTTADISTGSFTNQATVTGSSPGHSNDVTDLSGTAQSNDTPTLTSLVRAPSIEGWKLSELDDVDNSGGLSAGDHLIYTIYAKNTGNVVLTSVSVQSDTLTQADMTASANTLPAFTLVPGSSTTLNPGQIAQFRATYTVAQADIEAGGLSNTAVVKGVYNSTNYTDQTHNAADADGTATNGNSPTTDLVTLAPSIALVKTASLNAGSDGVVDAGDTISYSFTVTNTGNTTLSGITISDPLAPGSHVVSGGPVTLAPGASDSSSFSFSYTVTQADIDAGSVTNQATATGSSPGNTDDVSDLSGTAQANNTATVTALAAYPQIEAWKLSALTNDTAPAGLSAGDTLTYTVTIKNTGNVPVTGAAVQSDTLKRQDDTTATNSLSSFALSAGSASLAPGDTVSYTATYLVDAADVSAGGLKNTATAEAQYGSSTITDVTHDTADTDGRTTNYSEPTRDLAPGLAAISLKKTASTTAITSPSVGQVITYTLEGHNYGTVALTNVTLTDALTGGAILTAAAGVTDDNELDPEETWIWTASYTVTQADIDAGKVENIASLTGTKPDNSTITAYSGANGTVSSANNAPAAGSGVVTTISQNSAMVLVKTSSLQDSNANNRIEAGDSVLFQFALTNSGNTSLYNVGLTDVAASFTGTGTAPTPAYVSGDDGDSVLEVGETWLYRASYTITAADMSGVGYISNLAEAQAKVGSPTGTNLTAQSRPSLSANAGATTTFLGAICGTLYQNSATISGVAVKLYDSSGAVVATTTSSGSGTYCFTNLAPETYEVRFQATSSRNFSGYDGAGQAQGIHGGLNKVTAITIAYGAGSSRNYEEVNALTIDPSGVVYDAVTRAPISGATVTLLYNGAPANAAWVVGGSNTQTTGVDGNYSFFLQDPAQTGIYSLQVTATGYTSPSLLLPATASIYTPALGGGVEEMVTSATAPTGSESTRHYLSFAFTFADWTNSTTLSNGIVHNHIPMDTSAAGLTITKTASATTLSPATAGDVVSYTITVKNTGNLDVTSVTLTDVLTPNESWASSDMGDSDGSGTLEVGESWTYSASYTLSAADIIAGSIENVAQVSAMPAGGGTISAYSAANGVASTSATPPATGAGVVTRLSPALVPLVIDDLKTILKDDLAATMGQQGRIMSDIAAQALGRLPQNDGVACTNAIAALLQGKPIMFETASAILADAARPVLQELAALLAKCPTASFDVEGHTDNRASDVYNMALSTTRAKAVVKALSELGIDTTRLSAIGYGETRPVADNATEEGMQSNRRVVFTLKANSIQAAPCENTETAARDLDLSAGGANGQAAGSGHSESFDCATGLRRQHDWEFSYQKTGDNTHQGMFSTVWRREITRNANAIAGRFAGLYLSRSTVGALATGNIDGIGLLAGIYGARQVMGELGLGYYLGLSTGLHRFALSFDRPGGAVQADGRYRYGAVFAGGALQGQGKIGGKDVRPRLGIDLAYSPGGQASVTAARAGFADSRDFSIGKVSGARAYAEIAFVDLLADDATLLELTPRLFCDKPLEGSAGVCGYGLAMDYRMEGLHEATSYALHLDGEKAGDTARIAVSLSYSRHIWAGEAIGSLSFGQDQSLAIEQLLKWQF